MNARAVVTCLASTNERRVFWSHGLSHEYLRGFPSERAFYFKVVARIFAVSSTFVFAGNHCIGMAEKSSKFTEEEQVKIRMDRESEQCRRVVKEMNIPEGLTLSGSPLEMAKQLYLKEFEIRKAAVSEQLCTFYITVRFDHSLKSFVQYNFSLQFDL